MEFFVNFDTLIPKQMEDFKKKAIKYTVLLIVIFILQALFPAILTIVCDFLKISNPPERMGVWFELYNYLLSTAFALILFLDSRKEIINFILIPILCIFSPLTGVMFYFTAILYETSNKTNEQ